MKRINLYSPLAFLLFLISFLSVDAQIQNNVKWNFSLDQKGDEAVITFKATIAKGYHIYSQNTPPGGPTPTLINFEKS